jgi:hypothetical protein
MDKQGCRKEIERCADREREIAVGELQGRETHREPGRDHQDSQTAAGPATPCDQPDEAVRDADPVQQRDVNAADLVAGNREPSRVDGRRDRPGRDRQECPRPRWRSCDPQPRVVCECGSQPPRRPLSPRLWSRVDGTSRAQSRGGRQRTKRRRLPTRILLSVPRVTSRKEPPGENGAALPAVRSRTPGSLRPSRSRARRAKGHHSGTNPSSDGVAQPRSPAQLRTMSEKVAEGTNTPAKGLWWVRRVGVPSFVGRRRAVVVQRTASARILPQRDCGALRRSRRASRRSEILDR